MRFAFTSSAAPDRPHPNAIRFIGMLSCMLALSGCSDAAESSAENAAALHAYGESDSAFAALALTERWDLCPETTCELETTAGTVILHRSGAILSSGGDLVLVDTTGRRMRVVARAGKGPGEVLFPGASDYDAQGNLRIFDYPQRRIVLFDSLLRHVRTTPIPDVSPMMIPFISGERFHAVIVEPVSGTDSAIATIQASDDGVSPFRRIADIPTGFRFQEGWILKTKMFGSDVQYGADRAGNVIYVNTATYALHAVRPDGEHVLLATVDVSPSAVTEEDVAAELDRLLEKAENAPQLPGPRGVPMPDMRQQEKKAAAELAANAATTFPVLDRLYVLDDGTIWVRRYAKPGATEARWDAFRADGTAFGTLTLPASASIRGGTPQSLLVVDKGAEDQPLVKLLSLNPQP